MFKEGLGRKHSQGGGAGRYHLQMIENCVCDKERCSKCLLVTDASLWVNRMFWLFSVGFSTQLWPWEAGLNGPDPWVPWPSDYTLGLDNREYSQEIRGREESAVGLLIPPAPPHAQGSVVRLPFLHCGFATPLPHSVWAAGRSSDSALFPKLPNLSVPSVCCWVPEQS